MELNQPPPSSQNPESDLSTQAPPAQPLASSSQAPADIPQENIFRRIRSYPFHSDPSYQTGLSTILGHPSTPATPEELSSNPDLILQAQCFYFARKHGLNPIDVTEYKNFLALTSSIQSQPQVSRETNETPPLQRPDPVPRPSAPTPQTAASASTLSVQPHSQSIASPPALNPQDTTDPTAAAASQDPSPPYPTSFAEIVDLITQNKPIPGIEKVPETVLEPGSSKQDHTARRKKPWEKPEDTQPAPADATTTTDTENNDIEIHRQTGEGVLRILQPDAIPDSGLLAKD